MASVMPPNMALQTDERRVMVAAFRWSVLAPLAAERRAVRRIRTGGTMGLLDWLRTRRRKAVDYHSGAVGNQSSIYFEGGTGETAEAAIVVRGARFDLEGTSAEFAWLAKSYGQKDRDWKLLSHSHGKHGGRDIDTFELQLPDGTQRSVFFDCTESFGKSPPPEFFSGREESPEDTLP